jgi:DNA polymerase-1
VSILLQIHDELLFEVDEELVEKVVPKIKECMQNVCAQSVMEGVPIIVNAQTGKDWANMKEV